MAKHVTLLGVLVFCSSFLAFAPRTLLFAPRAAAYHPRGTLRHHPRIVSCSALPRANPGGQAEKKRVDEERQREGLFWPWESKQEGQAEKKRVDEERQRE